jgi:hypothetical protein
MDPGISGLQRKRFAVLQQLIKKVRNQAWFLLRGQDGNLQTAKICQNLICIRV